MSVRFFVGVAVSLVIFLTEPASELSSGAPVFELESRVFITGCLGNCSTAMVAVVFWVIQLPKTITKLPRNQCRFRNCPLVFDKFLLVWLEITSALIAGSARVLSLIVINNELVGRLRALSNIFNVILQL